MGVRAGDLLLTRSEGRGSKAIRLGAALRDEPNLINHVAVVHHVDKTGTTWCVEGRPGGVGWVDARRYLADPQTQCNAKQPKSEAQRAEVAKKAEAMLGTPYDWAGIAADAAGAFGLDQVWELRWGDDGEVPGQVVCSSLAAYLYAEVRLAHPEGDREVTPGQWLGLWIPKGWNSHPEAKR